MAAFLNVNEIKERVSLLSLLRNLGFAPQKKSGEEHFFLSMLREEYTASLCVNDRLGIWYDHGGAGVSGIKGGSIIDFALAYWYPSDFSEVLHKIVEYSAPNLDNSCHTIKAVNRDEKSGKVRNYQVDDVTDDIDNLSLRAYLKHRGIDNISRGQLYQLNYSVRDKNNRLKRYFAAGWPNENGGWEVRNKYFKGCLGHKGVSFIHGESDTLSIFEGYFDYLSWRVEYPLDPSSVLVLNSLSFLQIAKARAKHFQHVAVYFDHDRAGMKATREFLKDIKNAVDASFLYEGFKDYNDKLRSELTRSKISISEPMNFSIENGFKTDK